jgi:hypothetical protein
LTQARFGQASRLFFLDDAYRVDKGDAGESAVQCFAVEVLHGFAAIKLNDITFFRGDRRGGKPSGLVVLFDLKIVESGNADGADC